MKELIIPIKGMHCRSCELLLTESLGNLPDVKRADVSLKTKTATLFVQQAPSNDAVKKAVAEAGYTIGYDDIPLLNKNEKVYQDVAIGVVIIVALGLVFSRLGLTKLTTIGTGGASNGYIALTIGLTAGFSTCMAMVGGLVLSLSARHADKHPSASSAQKFRPHLFFNFGRIVSFIMFGALIGALGSVFQLRGSLLGLLTILVGVVMIMLGLQLTELFPRFSNGKLTLPSGLAKAMGLKQRGTREYSHGNSMLLGGATFFLPCGFTQAMQLLAISTGSPLQGALIMGAFAVGTSPGLLSVGGLTSIVKGAFAKKFFRIVGVAVVAMAFINISHGYNLLGLGNPFAPAAVTTTQSVAPKVTPAAAAGQAPVPAGAETILTTSYTLKDDIIPSKFTVKAGQKTTIIVDVKEDGQGCMSTIMIPGLVGNPQFLQGGSKIKMTFTAKKPGSYQITCAMGVNRGSISVI
ncbi:MAG: sulfite exporter TauE/SafE family protein [Candidatus Saccharibacteria bacterium]